MRGSHVPKRPIEHTTDFDHVVGYAGGVLPVYRENEADRVAACSCEIGTWAMMRYNLARYDALAGTSPEDTKDGLVLSHFEAVRKQPHAVQRAKRADAEVVDPLDGLLEGGGAT